MHSNAEFQCHGMHALIMREWVATSEWHALHTDARTRMRRSPELKSCCLWIHGADLASSMTIVVCLGNEVMILCMKGKAGSLIKSKNGAGNYLPAKEEETIFEFVVSWNQLTVLQRDSFTGTHKSPAVCLLSRFAIRLHL